MARKIRLLQVIDQLAFGGAEVLQETLARAIDHERFELYVCGLRRQMPETVGDKLRAAGIPVIVLEQRSIYDVRAMLRLVAFIRRNKIDIIHTHLIGADIWGRIAGFITRRPVVSTIHNLFLEMDDSSKLRHWLYRWTSRLLTRRIAVLDEESRTPVAAWLGLPLDRVLTIPNGIDLDHYRPAPDFDRLAFKRDLAGADYPLVLTLARLSPAKAHKDLLAAARLVVDAMPQVHFLLAGVGPLLDELEQQTRDLDLTNNVHFLGLRSDAAELLAASDLFVLPSVTEGVPLAIVEAMAAKTPVIATNVGGIPSVVHDQSTGVLVPPSDPPALAAAILQSLRDPAPGQRMAITAYDFVTARYSMYTWARQWQELYLRELGLVTSAQTTDPAKKPLRSSAKS